MLLITICSSFCRLLRGTPRASWARPLIPGGGCLHNLSAICGAGEGIAHQTGSALLHAGVPEGFVRGHDRTPFGWLWRPIASESLKEVDLCRIVERRVDLAPDSPHGAHFVALGSDECLRNPIGGR